MSKEYRAYYMSEIGGIEILGGEEGIVSLNFTKERFQSDLGIPSCLEECREQLDEYFKGKRKDFSLKIQLKGTDFQKRVWGQLLKIPYGKTASYREIAISMGKKMPPGQ